MTSCCHLLDTFFCYLLEGLGSQMITEHRVDSGHGCARPYHDEEAIVGHLNSRDIKLITPRIDFQLPKPNVLHTDRVDQFCRSLDTGQPDQALIKRFYQEVEMIPMREFKEALAACCEKVNTMISSSYILGIAKNKSQQFVAELALPFLKNLPQEICNVGTNTYSTGHTLQSKLSNKYRDHLIFDDGSYSGSQLCYTILDLCMENAGNLLTTPRVYIVIPYISSVALEALEDLRHHELVSQVRIHVITTSRRIKAVQDIFSGEEMKKLAHLFDDSEINGKCLTITEWKIADGASIPIQVRKIEHGGNDFQFVTDHDECYKPKKD